MNSCEYISTLTAISCQIVATHSQEEAELIAASLVQISDSIFAMLAHTTLCKAEKTPKEDLT